ncbi:hypothetical protein [Spirosoma linguale]|uniref:Uncharacterized protein n=1 Tax=Spirosoma linguale (strain ATCC 33905 / DSM 74 / LMG 10896 / Claus 1) TaxID=504472 RepID=D2QTV8_SPILD|nr:hypothetical protein Slin_6281 [Spirosoma linguale DSM 74]
MAMDQHAANLIGLTAKAFNGETAAISPTDGISLIDSWLSFLQSEGSATSPLTDALGNLKAELQSGNPNGEHVERIIKALSDQTKKTATTADEDSQPKLTFLAEAIQGFSQQLTGKARRDTSGEQAPMTSTVGGESTHSGAGASAFGTAADDLTDRNGGTVSSGPTVMMDDAADSDGRSAPTRTPDETNDKGSSRVGPGENSAASQESRSDTGRVAGMGVSGGAGDTDYSQSGGRSQY